MVKQLTHTRVILAALISLTAFLGFTVNASADSARIQERNGKTRLVLKLDSFSDKGRSRIRDVDVRLGEQRWDIPRSYHPYWSSKFDAQFASLAGATINVMVKRRRAATRRFQLTVTKKIEELPQPQPQPQPQPAKPPYPLGIGGLDSKWSATETDFTTTCSDNQARLEINIDQPVSIDGGPTQTGNFDKTIDLSQGQSFTLKVGQQGVEQTVRCRPSDLVLPQVEKSGNEDPEAKFYMVAPTLGGANNYLMILNQSGTPVWWYRDNDGTPLDFKLIDSNTVAWVRGVGPFSVLTNHYDLRGLDGNLKKTVSPVGYGADHHDIQPTADGGYLLLIYAPRDCPNTPSDCEDLSAWGKPAQANIIDGIIQKVDQNGNLVWQWNSRDHITLNESDHWLNNIGMSTLPDGSQAFDAIHLNSVEEDGNGFIFSARHLDAVYRVNATSGSIDWKIGGSSRPESLTVNNDPLASNPLAGQHDARVLNDGTVTIHDNGSLRSRPPRMVRYQISPGNATLIESISDPTKAPGSFCCGGGRRMPGGHWAVSWGANSLTSEYDENGNPLRRFYWPNNLFSYRVVPVLDGELSISDIRSGMDSQFPRN